MEAWQQPETIIKWIVIALVFLVTLMAFIIFLVRMMYKKTLQTQMDEAQARLEHQQALLETTITTQEKERERIAADLHDALIGKLTVLKMQQQMQAGAIENTTLIDESIQIARRISHDLSPPLLEYVSLEELIKELLEPWANQWKIEATYLVHQKIEHSNTFKIHLTRMLQEVLTNCNKYAAARTLTLDYRQTPTSTMIRIQDDGKGFDPKAVHKGLGLKNMETRVTYLKGTYRITSAPNKGTTTLFIFKNKPDA